MKVSGRLYTKTLTIIIRDWIMLKTHSFQNIYFVLFGNFTCNVSFDRSEESDKDVFHFPNGCWPVAHPSQCHISDTDTKGCAVW